MEPNKTEQNGMEPLWDYLDWVPSVVHSVHDQSSFYYPPLYRKLPKAIKDYADTHKNTQNILQTVHTTLHYTCISGKSRGKIDFVSPLILTVSLSFGIWLDPAIRQQKFKYTFPERDNEEESSRNNYQCWLGLFLWSNKDRNQFVTACTHQELNRTVPLGYHAPRPDTPTITLSLCCINQSFYLTVANHHVK